MSNVDVEIGKEFRERANERINIMNNFSANKTGVMVAVGERAPEIPYEYKSGKKFMILKKLKILGYDGYLYDLRTGEKYGDVEIKTKPKKGWKSLAKIRDIEYDKKKIIELYVVDEETKKPLRMCCGCFGRGVEVEYIDKPTQFLKENSYAPSESCYYVFDKSTLVYDENMMNYKSSFSPDAFREHRVEVIKEVIKCLKKKSLRRFR